MKEFLASVLFLAATALGWAQVPQNDFFTNRIQLNGAVVEIDANLAGATWGEAGCNEPCGVSGCAKSIWWSWTAPESGLVVIERVPFVPRMLPSYPNFSYASLSVFSSTNLCDLSSQQVCEINLLNHGAYAIFQAQAGMQYSIQLTGSDVVKPRFSSFQFRLTLTNAPVFRLQPVSRNIPRSGSTHFSVLAIGLSPVYYQWQKDGTLLPNATNRVISFDNITSMHEGGYRVVVSNATGTSTSQVAQLTLTPDLPLKLVTHPGTGGSEFRLSMSGPFPRRYQIRVSTDINPEGGLFNYRGSISHTNETTHFSLPRDTPSKFVRLEYYSAEEVCLNNLEQINIALWLYAEDKHLTYYTLVPPNLYAEQGYLHNSIWPRCPSAPADPTNGLTYTIDYPVNGPRCNFVAALHVLDY